MSSSLTVNPRFCQSDLCIEKFIVSVPPAESVPDEPAVTVHPSDVNVPDVPLTSEYCPEDEVIPA